VEWKSFCWKPGKRRRSVLAPPDRRLLNPKMLFTETDWGTPVSLVEIGNRIEPLRWLTPQQGAVQMFVPDS